jgi:hypothetical protein
MLAAVPPNKGVPVVIAEVATYRRRAGWDFRSRGAGNEDITHRLVKRKGTGTGHLA